ncbi:hypothetical protein ACV242_002500 [Peribacillus simplex]
MLNSGEEWDFLAYDKIRPNIGRLICKKIASLMEGQNRLGGIGVYTKAKGIGSSFKQIFEK